MPYCPECPHCAEKEPKTKPAKTCHYVVAWAGKCKKPVSDRRKNVCDLHAEKKCRCGRQATSECDAVIGPMVCGMPRCSRCHRHHY